jgi:host factor-I protein
MELNDNLQEQFLHSLCRQRENALIFLVTGIKLQGQIESFDKNVLILRGNNNVQMVYKHAIATILSSRDGNM